MVVVSFAIALLAGVPARASEAAGSGDCLVPADPARLHLTSLGPAVEGFPVNSAEFVGDRIYVASMDLSPARLLEYDWSTRRVLRTVSIPAGTRFWAMTAAGRELYLGLWNTRGQPNLYSFDPVEDTFTARATIPSQVEFWALAAGPDGTVFAGTDVSGQVSAYDPTTGQLDTLTFEDAPGSHVGALVATAETVYVGTRRQGGRILAIERSTGAVQELAAGLGDGVTALEASEDLIVAGTEGTASVVVIGRRDPALRLTVPVAGENTVDAVAVMGDTVYATAKPSGTLYALDVRNGQLRALGQPLRNAPTRALFAVAGRLLGVSAADTVWYHDPATPDFQRVNLVQAGAPGAPAAVMSLAAGGGRVFAGGNNRLQVREVASGAVTRTVLPGEPKDAELVGGLLYLGMYPYAQLLAYEPSADALVPAAAWDPQQNRPRDLDFADRRDRLLIATHSDELRRGALVGYIPATGTVSIQQDPLGGQSVESVATFRDTAYLGGTDADAALASHDLRSGQQHWSVVPVPGGGAITGLETLDRHLHGLTADGTYFVARQRDGAVVHRRRMVGAPGGEVVVDRGFVYAIGGDALVAIHPSTYERMGVVSDLQAKLFERPRIAVDESCALYLIRGSDVVRLSWEPAGAYSSP